MQPDSTIPPGNGSLPTGSAPPPLPASEPPLIGAPAPPPPEPARKPSPARQVLAFLLSACLGLFLADGILSLADDSLSLLFGSHLLGALRIAVGILALLMALLIYGLMGLAPMIPKRLFLPVALFDPVAALVMAPLAIYFYGRMQQVGWVFSFGQVVLGLAILHRVQGGFKLRWPLVAETQLAARRFSWRNLSVFLLVNVFVLLPAVLVYAVLCTALAISHFSEGFLALRPGGLTVQVRKYVRDDGKTIQLFPMSHVGDTAFYRKVSRSFPTNSIILMEGVTDRQNLLTNEISYKRLAASLGVSDQEEEFNPTQGELVWADVDIAEFTTNTIGLLNLAMLVHSKGLNAETLAKLMRFSAPSHYEDELLEDLLRKRNRRVLAELHARLPQSEHVVVPWGVAHMPGIAEGVQKAGFRLTETREYVAIRFGPAGKGTKAAGKAGDAGKPK